MAAIALTVEFLSDGRCTVTVGSHTATLQPSDGSARSARLQPSDIRGTAFRCPIPYTALGTSPVALRVVLPSGVSRSDDAFPRLEWRQEGHDWIGTATLPSAPAFVSLFPSTNNHVPPAAAFGWNFYGFFVFAVVFIAVYFAWARWTDRRDRTRVPA